jgi:uncharacterized protein
MVGGRETAGAPRLALSHDGPRATTVGPVTIELPLFPLGSVLFPGVVLPLHIFEPRYRQLVQELAALPEGAPRRFGVLAIRDGHTLSEVGGAGAEPSRDDVHALHDTGCTAEIDSITEYEDGRFDITTTGVHRFKLRDFDGGGPFPQGIVELLDEVPGPDAEVLAPGATVLFRKYQDALAGLRGVRVGEIPDLPEDPTVLSYLIGAAMVLDVYEKQRLLAAETTSERLRMEAKLLRRETGLLKNIPSLPAVDLLRRRR